jgi:hypothetical protein
MSEERLNDELAAIEAALSDLTPARSGIERDRLMFLAGKASAGRQAAFGVRRFIAAFCGTAGTAIHVRNTEQKAAMNRRTPQLLWPMATAASLLVAMAFGILWAKGSNPKPVGPTGNVAIAGSPAIAPVPGDTSPPSPWENRRLYRLVLEKGFDALPESTGHFVPGVRSEPRDETYRSLLKQFLDNPNG